MSDTSDEIVPIDSKIGSIPPENNYPVAGSGVISRTSENEHKGNSIEDVPYPPAQEALIEIEQVELKTIPKTPMDRLKQRLSRVDQLTFYPGAEIDFGTTPLITDIKNNEDELILRLEHKTNVVINEPGGIGIEKIDSLFKSGFMEVRAGGNDGRTVDSRYMKFCDENGRLVFRGICERKYTTVKCGSGVLGYIDGTALDMLNTPNVISKNDENEILFEIAINDKNTLKPPMITDEVSILSNGEIIGILGKSVTHKGSCFGIKFPLELKEETKAVLITAAFLVYASIFSKTSFGNNDGGNCCCCC